VALVVEELLLEWWAQWFGMWWLRVGGGDAGAGARGRARQVAVVGCALVANESRSIARSLARLFDVKVRRSGLWSRDCGVGNVEGSSRGRSEQQNIAAERRHNDNAHVHAHTHMS